MEEEQYPLCPIDTTSLGLVDIPTELVAERTEQPTAIVFYDSTVNLTSLLVKYPDGTIKPISADTGLPDITITAGDGWSIVFQEAQYISKNKIHIGILAIGGNSHTLCHLSVPPVVTHSYPCIVRQNNQEIYTKCTTQLSGSIYTDYFDVTWLNLHFIYTASVTL